MAPADAKSLTGVLIRSPQSCLRRSKPGLAVEPAQTKKACTKSVAQAIKWLRNPGGSTDAPRHGGRASVEIPWFAARLPLRSGPGRGETPPTSHSVSRRKFRPREGRVLSRRRRAGGPDERQPSRLQCSYSAGSSRATMYASREGSVWAPQRGRRSRSDPSKSQAKVRVPGTFRMAKQCNSI